MKQVIVAVREKADIDAEFERKIETVPASVVKQAREMFDEVFAFREAVVARMPDVSYPVALLGWVALAAQTADLMGIPRTEIARMVLEGPTWTEEGKGDTGWNAS